MSIKQAIRKCQSLAEISPTPKSWEAAMNAVVCGAVDFDDIRPLLSECASRADKNDGIGPHKSEKLIQWERIVEGLIEIAESCCDVADLNSTMLADAFVHMGQAADRAERSGAVS